MLDQENIARGHLAYYLKWTRETLEEAGDAFVAKGITTTDKLPGSARTNRRTAIDSLASAQKLFAGYDFVNATFAAQKAWRAAAA